MATDAEIATRRLNQLVAITSLELTTSSSIKDSIAAGRYKNDLKDSIAVLQNNIEVGRERVAELNETGDVRSARLP